MQPEEFRSEGQRVAAAAQTLGLKHVVVTSVARDDLADGGAQGFVETIRALRTELPQATVEVLIPDLRGNLDALRQILDARPDVLNHNLETVPRLYRRVRPGASYQRSLKLLQVVSTYAPGVIAKTGIMLGLGEEQSEVAALMEDCKQHQVQSFTAGQYLQPTREHLPVSRYLSPEEFSDYEKLAKAKGFKHVAIGPLVRSSYHADQQLDPNFAATQVVE